MPGLQRQASSCGNHGQVEASEMGLQLLLAPGTPPLSLNRTSCPYCPGPAFVAQTSEGESGNSTLAVGRVFVWMPRVRGVSALHLRSGVPPEAAWLGAAISNFYYLEVDPLIQPGMRSSQKGLSCHHMVPRCMWQGVLLHSHTHPHSCLVTVNCILDS